MKFNFLWDLIFLRKFGYTNKFIHVIEVASTNTQSKIKINDLVSDSFILVQGLYQASPFSMMLCITVAEVITVFSDTDSRIKSIQVGDHEIKTVNFADDTTIFLGGFSCLTKIKLIFKLLC